MNKTMLIKKAITQPITMFLLGMATTIIILISITPTIAEPNEKTQNNVLNTIANLNTEIPRQTAEERNIASPKNYFDTHQIKVYRDRVILDAENIVWAGFEDTKSMLPIINKDTNALQIIPNCPEDIQIGDIVSYKSHYAEGIIIHRVIHIDQDSKGTYFVLKGDNNPSSDPGKIRCNQIQRKVVAIIY